MQYTAILNADCNRMVASESRQWRPIYVIMGRYEVALAGRIFAGT